MKQIKLKKLHFGDTFQVVADIFAQEFMKGRFHWSDNKVEAFYYDVLTSSYKRYYYDADMFVYIDKNYKLI